LRRTRSARRTARNGSRCSNCTARSAATAGGRGFDELLNPKSGLFSKKEDPELRACAAIALGRIGTARAQQALQKPMSEKEVVVRNAVNRALKGGAGGNG